MKDGGVFKLKDVEQFQDTFSNFSLISAANGGVAYFDNV